MRELLAKEARLTAPIITYLFVAFATMTMLPGYPILVGAFFVCFGIFQCYQTAREANDILYTTLLPVRKADVVRSKFLFTAAIELAGFAVAAAFTVLRMVFLADAPVYVANAMMNANPAYLGYFLMVCASFNVVFLRGFFKTGYGVGRPFVAFIIVASIVIGAAEALHFVSGLASLNLTVFSPVQLVPLAVGVVVFPLATLASLRSSIRVFESLDL